MNAGRLRRDIARRSRIAALSAFVTVALFPAACASQELSRIPAAFVDVGIGAREMGMGGAAIATSTGPSAIFWNPAGLALPGSDAAVMITHGVQLGLVPYSAAAGMRRVGERWAVGAGVMYSGDDALSEMTLFLSAATDVGTAPWTTSSPLLVGASLRARRASFGNNESAGAQVTGSAMGAALDAGAVVPLNERTRGALSLRDVAGVLNWDSSSSGSYEEGVPPSMLLGIAMDMGDQVLVEVDLDKALRLECRDVVSVGGEGRLFGVAALRVGYRKALPPHELEEFSVGGGAVVKASCYELALDVAYVFGALENTLRLGVGFSF